MTGAALTLAVLADVWLLALGACAHTLRRQ